VLADAAARITPPPTTNSARRSAGSVRSIANAASLAPDAAAAQAMIRPRPTPLRRREV
jgi:hypothetical protein